MSLPKIKVCPCTLQPGYSTYSPTGELLLFGSRSKKVSHVLSFSSPGEETGVYNEKRKRICISGVQEKYLLKLVRNNLLLTESGGTHILKPIPAERLELVNDLPANEHISMQIARQVFGIKTATCGMVLFSITSLQTETRT